MAWLVLGVLGIMWAAFLLPRRGRPRSPGESVDKFERGLELLSHMETNQTSSGRWIVTPQKGVPFLGQAERQRARARQRRRQVFVFLLEAIGLTFLIGLVPPLRGFFWGLSMVGAVLLGAYVMLLLWMKNVETTERMETASRPQAARVPVVEPRFLGPEPFDDMSAHVVIKPAAAVAQA